MLTLVHLQWPARDVGNVVARDPDLLDACFGEFVTLASAPYLLRIQEGEAGSVLEAVDRIMVGRYWKGFTMVRDIFDGMPIG